MIGWEPTRLSAFCATGSGSTPSRSQLARFYEGGTIPWVKSGELRESVISSTEEYVTEAALKETSVKMVPAGALLLAMYGATVGRLGILGIPATTNQAVCHIVPDPKVADTRFLFHALSHQVPAIVARGVGRAQPNISQAVIKDLLLPVPPLAEQRRIAEVLDRAEALRTKRRAGEVEELQKAAEESRGLGLFVRTLVGLERGAAKEAFAGFLDGKQFAANQVEFINLIINHLTEQGVMSAELLYESPFIDLDARGPDGLFSPIQLKEIVAVLERVRGAALAQ